MGGEGSTQHMIITMRNNLNMLRRKSMFKRERTFLSVKKEYYKASKGKIASKKLTKEELLLIRNKVIANRRSESIRTWLIFFVIVISIIVLGIYILNR